ncbi:TonB-dependent receptor [Puniceicoccaceae bacterium K14]|nr:TonB-dependent receptor [Puniceicoccaceae bacterium K14]
MKSTRNAKSLGSFIWKSVVIFASFFTPSLYAQDTGSISGTVLDVEYGGTVYSARISVVELQKSSTANMDGKFFIPSVPEGEYTLVVTAEYYKTARITEVKVVSGEITKLDVPMYNDTSDTVELAEFVVKAEVLAESDLGLLNIRQKSASVSDAIGTESFGRLGLSDAADALTKVTGVSISDGKYAVVRGLSDRYNNTTMNGTSVPSADPDRRAVQLDQFPSGIVDTITTVKTFTPDLGGNFTGGYVDIKTKSIPDQSFMRFSVGIGYNDQSSLEDLPTANSGGDDWLGKDDGSRAIPGELFMDDAFVFPGSANEEQLQVIDDAVRAVDSQIYPNLEESPLDYSFSMSYGNRFILTDDPEKMNLGVVTSLNYKRSFSGYSDGLVGRYDVVAGQTELETTQEFQEQKGVDEASMGSVVNIGLQINASHEIGLNTTYTQSGQNEAIIRSGSFPETVDDDIFRIGNIHYTERTVGMNQLYGKHRLDLFDGMTVDWSVADSKSIQQEPDFRLFYDAVSEDGSRFISPGRSNISRPRRYWRRLDEGNEQYKIDFAMPFSGIIREVKFGYDLLENERDFSENVFAIFDFRPENSYDGDPSSYLSDENIGIGSESGEIQRYIGGFSSSVPQYKGFQEVEAVYLMADFNIAEDWRVVFGGRHESTDILLQSFTALGNPLGDDSSIVSEDWLPALNVTYAVNNKMNLRFAATKTLARPNFRELSPFGSFDNVGGENFIGNPLLEMSNIDNVDLRWEWYPKDGEVYAISAFTKTIEKPIEQTFDAGQLTYFNAEEATVEGIEMEARKSINALSSETSRVVVGGNLTLIDSEIVGADRQLQGQSPLVANFDISYEQFSKGTLLTLAYNYTDERLYSVGDRGTPNVNEEAYSELNFVASQKLRENLKMKFKISNLLDEDRSLTQEYEGSIYTYNSYQRGRTFSLSFSYDYK